MGKIISIRKNDVNVAEGLFSKLMTETENIMNMRALNNKWSTTNEALTSSSIEKESLDAIKKACCRVKEFNPEEVKLISGHKFPDIVAEKYFGVEVKSTTSDHWRSTGSSIVESTRVETVESIYVLFGKLGGIIAEFRCRPYADVMYDIAVTHSPRYLIDMELPQGKTIFDKINCDYDSFRKDPDSIKKVKKYYKEQAKKGQMPWWIDENEENPLTLPVNIRLWNTLDRDEKEMLRAMLFILFPEVVKGEYGNAVMWLVSAKGVVNPSFRDSFSAGGKVNPVSWEKMDGGVPQVWKNLFEDKDIIKNLLGDGSIYPYLREYNPILLESKDIYKAWVHQISSLLLPQTIYGKKYCIEKILIDIQ